MALFRKVKPTKEPEMAGNETTIDYDKLGAAVAKAMGPAVSASLADANKPLVEALEKLTTTAATPPAAKAEGADKPLTAADVTRIVTESLTAARTSDQQTAARQQVINEKLKDLPVAYRNQLGNDPAKWATEEQAIRDAYKADFAAAGGTTPNVGGNNGGAGATKVSETLDLSKLSPTQLIAQGLKTSKPQGAPATAAVGGVVGGGAAAAGATA